MTTIIGIVILVGTLVAFGALVAAHFLPTGLNPLRDPVSQYGISRHPAPYRVAAVSAAVAGLGVAFVFAPLPGVMSFVTLVLLMLFVISRALIPFFPMDAPTAAKTSRGRLHNVLASLAFGGVTAAAFTGAGVLHDAGSPALAMWSTVSGVVMAVGAIGLLVASRVPPARGLFGAFERLIYLGFLFWFALLGSAAI